MAYQRPKWVFSCSNVELTDRGGKSTLIEVLGLIRSKTSGLLHYDGHRVNEDLLASLRPNVAILLQKNGRHNLYQLLILTGYPTGISVREFVRLTIPPSQASIDDEIIKSALSKSGFPWTEHLDSKLGKDADDDFCQVRARLNIPALEDWMEPSGGQAQALFLAIFYLKANNSAVKLLILDEPECGLDENRTEFLKKMIEELKDAGKTIIIVTHSMVFNDLRNGEISVTKKINGSDGNGSQSRAVGQATSPNFTP